MSTTFEDAFVTKKTGSQMNTYVDFTKVLFDILNFLFLSCHGCDFTVVDSL